jgi:hypothetical protein
MGSLIGILTGIYIVVLAWEGELTFWGIPLFLALTLIGVFLLPRTVGRFFIFIVLSSPIAIIAGLLSGNYGSALTALAIGVTAFLAEFIIGNTTGRYRY